MAGGCRRRIAIRGPTLPGSELVLQTLRVYGGSEHHVACGCRRLGEGRELCGAADSKCLMPRRPGNREPGGVSQRQRQARSYVLLRKPEILPLLGAAARSCPGSTLHPLTSSVFGERFRFPERRSTRSSISLLVIYAQI